MKFWHFLNIFWFLKILSLKSLDNSITVYPNSGRILCYCHHCYYYSFLPVRAITITHNYIQINKAHGFFAILKIWGLRTDYMQKWFFKIKTRDRLWNFLVHLNTIEGRLKISLWLVSVGITSFVIIAWF